jgi:GT2 family glycosyltransferase
MVVDNGSTPALRVEGAYPFEFDVLRCETPGSYAARNAGAKIARGAVLAFIDADCVPDADWLAAGIAALERGEGRCVVGGEVRVLPPQPRTGVGLYQYLAGFQQEENIRRKHFTVTANLFCYAEQFERIGPFTESLMSAGDLEWGQRARDASVAVLYASSAMVFTRPRTSMSAAIRQARRVAGGRKYLRVRTWNPAEPGLLKPHRSALTALRWIASRTELSLWERCKVLWAALIIRLAVTIEYWRLSLGARPERQ